MKKIVLINPPQLQLFNPLSYPPLSLMYIASSLEEKGYDVEIHNQPHKSFEDQKDEIPDGNIYGITTTTATLYETRKIVSFLKKRNPDSITVVGGVHATVNPEETKQITDADYIFSGEGEILFPKVCKNLSKKGGILRAERISVDQLNMLPFPAHHLIKKSVIQDESGIHLSGEYKKNNYATTVISSRGCPYNCAFCCKTHVTSGFRYRSVDNFFKELIHLRDKYDIHQFRIIDDAFTTNKKRVLSLMERTKGEELYFTTILRADSIDSKDMLYRMYDGGVRIISIGVESASQKILNIINKRESIDEIKRVIRWCKEVGIKIKVFFIFGLPGETLETVEMTKRFFREMKPDMFTLSSFVPLPGSAIYENPRKFGLKPRYNKGEYENFWFYWEPEDIDKGFFFDMPLELRKARGDLIRYLRSKKWRK